MAKIKIIDMESDTFSKLKQDMTDGLNRLITNMESYGSDEASLTVKVKIKFEDQCLDDGKSVTVPSFEHKVSYAVQIKREAEGKLEGMYSLEEGEKGQYRLKPLNDQMDMFEEMDEE